ncbi:MAG: SDR family NAD(P)-dependent oxidoreductase, partial [Candidatus Brocadiae bacterium]|nr:SDR family NAD(P)-dependent oxidoreductase [Candidatus Brocadiia bacterium]
NTDLGIDSIKRVEIFSSLKEKLPQAQAIQTEHIGKLKTLRDIVDFLSNPQTKQEVSVKKEAPVLEKKQQASLIERKTLVLENIPLDSRKPIKLKPGSVFCIAGERSVLTESISQNLISLGYSPFLVSVEAPREIPKEVSGLIIVSPEKMDNAFLKNALFLAQKAYPALKRSAEQEGAVLATLSFLDGCFGLGNLNHEEVLAGGLAGLSKTAHHEWPWIHAKSLDVAPDYVSSPKAAKEIVEEILISDPVEVGLTGTSRVTIKLASSALVQNKPPFSDNEVILVTGGARGVTASCAIKFAENMTPSPTLILMGRTPKPKQEPENIVHLQEEAAIKREIMSQEKKITPRELEARYKTIMAEREIRQTIATLESKGSKAEYYSLDVRDKNALAQSLEIIQKKYGKVTGLIHGAGVIADQFIENKSPESFDLVYETKVIGLSNLLELLPKENLKFLAFFSSSTARFGRTGQVDYAIANEVLNKIAQRQARLYPSCRVVSVNWGPWDGGMVTPSLAKIFEKEGVGLIPIEAGAEQLWKEVCAQDGNIEVVILGSLHGTQSPKASETLTLAFDRELDIDKHPFLKAHILDNKAVLPVAVIVEWLSHGAMHLNPGFSFYGFENLSILKGLKIPKNQIPLIQVLAQKAEQRDGFCVVPTLLRTTWDKKNFDLNAKANIILGSPRTQETRSLSPITRAYPHTTEEMYQKFLFHGEIFQGIEKVQGLSQEGISALVRASGNPSEWMQNPLRNRWITDPLALDCAFQMMILWSFDCYGCASLPCSIGKFQQMRKFPKESIQIHAQVKSHSETKAISDIEFLDSKGTIAIMQDYECTLHGSLKNAFELNYIS